MIGGPGTGYCDDNIVLQQLLRFVAGGSTNIIQNLLPMSVNFLNLSCLVTLTATVNLQYSI